MVSKGLSPYLRRPDLRLLLDENLDPRISELLPGHGCKSVVQMGWRGISNGELLRKADGIFDVLLTLDKGLPHQQNLSGLAVHIVVIRSVDNKFESIKPKVDELLNAITSLENATTGTVLWIG